MRISGKVLTFWLTMFLFGALTLAPAAPILAQDDPADARIITAWSSGSTALNAGHVVESSPVIVNLDKVGGSEIILGTTAQKNIPQQYTATPKLIVANADGSIKWAASLDAPVTGSPAVGDIDGDGDLEIVVPLGGDVGDLDNNGGIIAFNHTGNQLWRYNSQDHRDGTGNTDGWADGVRPAPTLCDLDGDGDLEIAFGSFDQRIHLVDHMGKTLWNNLPTGAPAGPGFYNADSVWSSPACADFNSDGSMEIVIGAAISGGGILPDGTRTVDGGFLYVFDRLGNVLVRRFIPEDIQSSPAIGDLDNDGDLEIVVGTGWYWWNVHGRTATPYVYAFDTSQIFSNLPYADDSKLPHMPGWPQVTNYPGFSSPALADLDGDNDLEIIIGAGDPFIAKGDPISGDGSIYAWHHNGQLVPGWPISPRDWAGNGAAVFSSPVVADVDNDGQLEIMFAHIWEVLIHNADGSFQERLGTFFTIVASPAVGDADGDGKAEIWIGGSDDREKSQGYLWRFESTDNLGAAPWPMFQRDPQHTSLYPQKAKLNVPVTDLLGIVPTGTASYTAHILIRNTGGVSMNWSTGTAPARVTAVQPASGTLAPGAATTIKVTVNSSGLGAGVTTIGNLAVTSSNADGSPQSVQIRTLVTGTVYKIFLPSILR